MCKRRRPIAAGWGPKRWRDDVLAIGAPRVVAEAGRPVPDDFAVLGFDGTDESALSVPALTTINPGKGAIARAAAELIGPPGQARAARQSAGGVPAQREIQVPFALIPRESTDG